MDRPTADGIATRERINCFLRESGLASERAGVVPLTGDASDRKYFRIMPADGPTFVLALKGITGVDVEFRRRFDLMALQRNLKALGTFGYQTMTRRNPVYIQYIPRTLRYVRENLQKYPRFAALREILAAHIDELS